MLELDDCACFDRQRHVVVNGEVAPITWTSAWVQVLSSTRTPTQDASSVRSSSFSSSLARLHSARLGFLRRASRDFVPRFFVNIVPPPVLRSLAMSDSDRVGVLSGHVAGFVTAVIEICSSLSVLWPCDVARGGATARARYGFQSMKSSRCGRKRNIQHETDVLLMQAARPKQFRVAC